MLVDVIVDESAGNASFDVMLTSSDTDTVTVDYATVDGTGLAGSDYTTTSGTATLLPGDTVETVEVPVLDDVVAEEEEAFTLNLQPGRGHDRAIRGARHDRGHRRRSGHHGG